MSNMSDLPLLLFDNSNMMDAINEGEFKCSYLELDDAKHIIESFEDDILQCFSNSSIENIMFDYLGINRKNYKKKQVTNMRVNQYAIVFKIHITPSETQPIIKIENGVEAKKIQNVYVYCVLLSREK